MTQEDLAHKGRRWGGSYAPLTYFLAFLLPALAALVSFVAMQVAPFGDYFFTNWDCYTQYVDYLDWLRQVLTGNGSLLYSFGKSLGGNTVGLFAYYVASPLNLFIAFTPEGSTLSFMTIITIVKIGLCGLTMSIFLTRRFKLRMPLVVALSIGFALSDYVATLSICCIMWMEALILLPLVMLGVYRWITEHKKTLYLASAALTVYCCWYTAYMVFLFTILYYLYEYYLANGKTPFKRWIKDLLLFGLLMCVALLLSAFILLPVVYAQLGGVSEPFDLGLRRRAYLTEYPSALFTGSTDLASLPQICCGTVTLFALALFFFNRNIKRSERVATALFLILMVGSTYIVLGDEIWNAFRITRGYYCRFSFLIVFLMVFMAGRSFEAMERPRPWQVVLVTVIFLALAASAYALYVSTAYLVWVLALIAIVGALFLLLPRFPKAVGVLFVTLTLAEMGLNYYTISNLLVDGFEPAENYSEYRQTQRASWNELKATDSSWFRAEKTYNRLNTDFTHEPPTEEGMVLGYSQISHYSSTNDTDLATFFDYLGYSQDEMGSSNFNQSILLSDSLLGIKYVFNSDGTVTENSYALPIGYAASSEILNSLPTIRTEGCEDYKDQAYALRNNDKESGAAYETKNPFEEQNAFISMILGEDVECFKPLEVTQTVDTDSSDEWTVDKEGHDNVYAFIDSNHLFYCTLSVGNENLGEYNFWTSYYVFNIDSLADGDTIKLDVDTADGTLTGQKLIAYYLDMDVFEQAMEKLQSTSFTPDVVEDGYVQGTYTTDEDTLLFTTIPYDKGWTVKVNGQEVDTQEAFDTFLAIPVSAGENEITMTYVPQGLTAGVALSSAALLVLVGSWLFRRHRERKAVAKAR